MRRASLLSITIVFFAAVNIPADTFGTGANQFTIDFVTISGNASSANGTYIGFYKPEGFADPEGDYRMGKYEITNDQWNKFQTAYGTVAGDPSYAYNQSPYWTGTNLPTNYVSWCEAVQFVNFLNTSKGYQPAYKFTGTKGTSNYTFVPWSATDIGYNASNPFRNSSAFYFLPTENEWVKAAYWNGTNLQTYATKAGESVYQGNGFNGGWNYYDNAYATNPPGPWAVGTGSQELNGTYDMMGNVWEWMESPFSSGDYKSGADRILRGGSYYYYANLVLDTRFNNNPYEENGHIGFRIASVPEPATLLFITLGGMILKRKK